MKHKFHQVLDKYMTLMDMTKSWTSLKPTPYGYYWL